MNCQRTAASIMGSLLGLAVALSFTHCARPQMKDSDKSSPRFNHSSTNADCQECHEKDRPAPRANVPHGAGSDCRACHAVGSSWDLSLNAQPETPSEPGKPEPTVNPHDPTPASCAGCHAKDTPVPNHYSTFDCVECHSYPKWSAVKPYNHVPKPASCNSCHEKDRPTGHFGTKDCFRCHDYPSWTG